MALAIDELDPSVNPTVPVWHDDPNEHCAARALGISRYAAYEAAKRGDIPTIRIGRRVMVPTAPLLEMLGRQADTRPVRLADLDQSDLVRLFLRVGRLGIQREREFFGFDELDAPDDYTSDLDDLAG